MDATEPLTVVETPSFLRDSKGLLIDDEREALVNYLAYHPTAGDRMRGTGGVRKVRWAREFEGKSGGYRVIYFYHSQDVPLFALNVFAKNEKANLTQAERNELKKLAATLVENYTGRGGRK
ncbi:MAG: type II toxin-antitoxin system RelE/ParE family toxin [Treponematales bacterium]